MGGQMTVGAGGTVKRKLKALGWGRGGFYEG